MLLQVDAGGEKWLPWARRKAAALDAMRREDAKVEFLAKTYAPEAGSLVFIKVSDAGAQIRITASSAGALYLTSVGDDCACDGDQVDSAQFLVTSSSVETDEDGVVTTQVLARVRPVQRYNNEIVWMGDWQDASYTRVFTPGEPGASTPGNNKLVRGGILHSPFLGGDIPITDPGAGNSGNGFDISDDNLLWVYDSGTDSFTSLSESDLQTFDPDAEFRPDATTYVLGSPDVVTGSPDELVETYVHWREGTVLRNGVRSTEDDVVTDGSTTTAIATYFAPYPGPQASTCALFLPDYDVRWQAAINGNAGDGPGAPGDTSTITLQRWEPQYTGVAYDPRTGYTFTDLGSHSGPTNSIVANPFTPPIGWSQAQENTYLYSLGWVFTGTPSNTLNGAGDVGNPAQAATDADQARYDAVYPDWLQEEEDRVERCAARVADRVARNPADEEVYSTAYDAMAASDFEAPLDAPYPRETPPAADATVTMWPIEYDYDDAGTLGTSLKVPAGATILLARVGTGVRVPAYYDFEDPDEGSRVTRFTGREVELDTFVGNAVAQLSDAGPDFAAELATQRADFLDRLADVSNVIGDLSDEDKVLSMFYDDLPAPVV